MEYGILLEPFRLSNLEKDRISKDYALLQKKTIGRTAGLLSARFPDYRLEMLSKEIDKLVLSNDFKALGNSAKYEKEVVFCCENMHNCKSQDCETA